MNTHSSAADSRCLSRFVSVLLTLSLLPVLVSPSLVGAGVFQDIADDEDLVDKGRYLVRIAGCNDCHTSGYANTGGAVPEKDWLTGDAVGWVGPWGTTYPQNLRLFAHGITEAQWLTIARTVEYRPPMPWFALRAMSDTDLRAIYRYLQHLGPAGKPAPAYLPPEQRPTGAYFEFRNSVPQ